MSAQVDSQGVFEAESEPPPGGWLEANQRCLSAGLALIKLRLESTASDSSGALTAAVLDAQHALAQIEESMPAPSALDTLGRVFGLSNFERDLLLLCAGFELDSDLSARFGSPQQVLATFSMALATLPDAHWSALTPSRPLRHFGLLEVQGRGPLVTSSLRIDERVLHYLTGVGSPDTRLDGIIEPVESEDTLVPSHERQVQEMLDVWTNAAGARLPVIELWGNEPSAKRSLVTAACAHLGLRLYAVTAPTRDLDEKLLVRLLTREALLSPAAFLLNGDGQDPSDEAAAPLYRRLADAIAAPIVLERRERGSSGRRHTVSIEVKRPSLPEQRSLFLAALSDGLAAAELETAIDRVVAQFDLGVPAIHQVSIDALRHATSSSGAHVGAALWDTCRAHARAPINELAQRIDTRVTWDDLVLPEQQRQTLREIDVRMRHRTRVYDTWGFAAKGTRGLGLSVLFSGPSGTGKTLAAEVLANELRLDLYRVDLSQVVSKYIGETERNLRRVFDAAESGSCVLLFDEADALFGKRTEAKDSHDRYANIEVSYLLQRIETYRGLAILTTNFKSALDAAFLRRLAFVVEFPTPDQAQRAEIWRRVFPAQTPACGLDYAQLARFALSGGNIRNVALAAAFLAAEANEPVQVSHILSAARTEFTKLERSMPSELGRTLANTGSS